MLTYMIGGSLENGDWRTKEKEKTLKTLIGFYLIEKIRNSAHNENLGTKTSDFAHAETADD